MGEAAVVVLKGANLCDIPALGIFFNADVT